MYLGGSQWWPKDLGSCYLMWETQMELWLLRESGECCSDWNISLCLSLSFCFFKHINKSLQEIYHLFSLQGRETERCSMQFLKKNVLLLLLRSRELPSTGSLPSCLQQLEAENMTQVSHMGCREPTMLELPPATSQGALCRKLESRVSRKEPRYSDRGQTHLCCQPDACPCRS